MPTKLIDAWLYAGSSSTLTNLKGNLEDGFPTWTVEKEYQGPKPQKKENFEIVSKTATPGTEMPARVAVCEIFAGSDASLAGLRRDVEERFPSSMYRPSSTLEGGEPDTAESYPDYGWKIAHLFLYK